MIAKGASWDGTSHNQRLGFPYLIIHQTTSQTDATLPRGLEYKGIDISRPPPASLTPGGSY